MRGLHNLYYPTEIELHSIFFNVIRSKSPLHFILLSDNLKSPTTKKEILDNIGLGHLGIFPKNIVKNKFNKLLKFYLKELPSNLNNNISNSFGLAFTINL